MKKGTIINKSSVTIHGVKPGGSLAVEVDENGTPLDKLWRRRLADASIDGAVVLIPATGKKKKEEN